ncbi:MAG: radical SAM protein [Deltaproteobacteria bacterium]|nr:radical SAM protein [Deltaproteobacteria bacterium]
MTDPCRLCPRECGAHRASGERGRCLAGARPLVARWCVHRGEEPAISGQRGSGTVFFAGCHLRCVYCQNHQISQGDVARHETTVERLADAFLELAAQGAHNINLVSPSTQLPQIASALREATARGLDLPIVYNSSGFDGLAALHQLDGLIDVYLPDFKYATPRLAGRLSGVVDYPPRALAAIAEMQRQVGRLIVDGNGVARRGLLVRHLVLPGRWYDVDRVLESLVDGIGFDVAVSLMAQYGPAHRAGRIPDLDRPLTEAEYGRARLALERVGLTRGFVQELTAATHYRPDFARADHPFE